MVDTKRQRKEAEIIGWDAKSKTVLVIIKGIIGVKDLHVERNTKRRYFSQGKYKYYVTDCMTIEEVQYD